MVQAFRREILGQVLDRAHSRSGLLLIDVLPHGPYFVRVLLPLVPLLLPFSPRHVRSLGEGIHEVLVPTLSVLRKAPFEEGHVDARRAV
jgi:hypothetical protein